MESTAGKLLVASPLIGDPNFERSVVLILEHDDLSALGLVLNSPTQTQVSELLPQWGELCAGPSVFFLGGPVSPESVICLGTSIGGSHETFRPVTANLGTVDLNQSREELGLDLEEIRMFAGYSGWGPGQLEGELLMDAWFVVDADPRDALMSDPDELWSMVLARQPGPMAWLANYPIDPSLN